MMRRSSSTPRAHRKTKGLSADHGNVIANARQISEWLGFTERRSPADNHAFVSHECGFGDDDVSALRRRLYCCQSKVFGLAFLANISDYQITSFGSVATMLIDALEHLSGWCSSRIEDRQLRFAMCGSAPVPAEVLKRFEETFNCLVIEGYGLSESTCRSTFNPPDERRRPGSCGLPIGNEMRVVDEEDGKCRMGTG